MTYNEVMKELKKMGTAQNRKVYARHGVGEDMFGVSFADLGRLKKKIKVDHELAEKLWASGNHDARVLAAMVANPAATKSTTLDAWVKDLDNYVIADAFSSLASRTKFVHTKMEKWTRSSKEWVGRAGWRLVAAVALQDGTLTNPVFVRYLNVIESDIHDSENHVRDAMNNAVIAIGVRNSQLEKKAIAAAKKIGKVEVDHGETGCKTPDAIDYIKKTLEHRTRLARKIASK
jgi:3-methyladenine DNA glycosylase AlkD